MLNIQKLSSEVFSKISQIWQENTCVGISFCEVAGLKINSNTGVFLLNLQQDNLFLALALLNFAYDILLLAFWQIVYK